jgi:hypothetical protein
MRSASTCIKRKSTDLVVLITDRRLPAEARAHLTDRAGKLPVAGD